MASMTDSDALGRMGMAMPIRRRTNHMPLNRRTMATRESLMDRLAYLREHGRRYETTHSILRAAQARYMARLGRAATATPNAGPVSAQRPMVLAGVITPEQCRLEMGLNPRPASRPWVSRLVPSSVSTWAGNLAIRTGSTLLQHGMRLLANRD